VTPNRSAKSSGSENTYAEDVTNLEVIRTELDRMARRGAEWLERKALCARTVTIKVRYSDFTTITRSHSERPATRDPGRIATRALRLADNTEAGARPIRLLGVSLHNLMGDDEVAREPNHPTLPL
jgi:DNA polymerase-4